MAHTVRVGCVAALQRLDFSELRLKAWIGWQPSSQVWQQYSRNPAFLAHEVVFLRRFFAQAIRA